MNKIKVIFNGGLLCIDYRESDNSKLERMYFSDGQAYEIPLNLYELLKGDNRYEFKKL